jgi:DNA-binding IscR family transcriptional regulator
VTSEKGHGGGWKLAHDLEVVTMHDIYSALDNPAIFAIGNRTESPGCLVEKAVNRVMNESFEKAEALLLARFKQVKLSELREDVRQQRGNHPRPQEQEEERQRV